jgi:fibronectin type 3 domain-containing protein
MENGSTRHRNLALIVIVVTAAIVTATLLYALQLEPPDDNTPPSKVEGVEVHDLHDGKLFLFWDTATDNRKVAGYHVFRDGNQLPNMPSYPFFVDSNLIDNTLYFYKVRAVDAYGNVGDLSDQVSGMPTPSDNVPPSRVDGLVVENAFSGKLNLSWNEAFDNVDVEFYRVYRDGVRLLDEPLASSYQDTGLTDGQNYTYEVSAVDTSGNEGQQSLPASGTPTEHDSYPPSKVMGLIVTDAKDGKLDLAWNPASDNVGVGRYYVYRDGLKLGDEPTGTTYRDTGLNNSQMYTYRVSAVDLQGNEGLKSDPETGTPMSSVPGVTIMGNFHDSVTYNVTVFFVSDALDIGLFGAFLYVDSNETDSMDPLSDGATAGNITFLDMDSNGLLTIGDVFVISVSSGHDYELSIFWRETDDILDTDSWTVP